MVEGKREAFGIRKGVMVLVLAFVVGVAAFPGSRTPFGAPSSRTERVGGAPRTPSFTEVQRSLQSRLARLLGPDASSGSLLLLVGIAAAYGVIHALGPGHQKTLLAGYFLSESSSLGRAALAALGTAALHAASALLIVGGAYLAARALSLRSFEQSRLLIERGAGYALVVLALWMLYSRIKGIAHRHREHAGEGRGHGEGKSGDCPACARAEAARRRGAPLFGLVLAGGIVPCPGAAMLVLLAVGAGNFLAGVLAALALSAGMGLTLFAVSATALGIRKGALESGHAPKGPGGALLRSAFELGGALLVLGFALVVAL